MFVRSRTVVSLLVASALTAVAAGVGAAPAAAHAGLREATPEDGATTPAIPTQVSLRFTEDIGKIGVVVRVTGPTGDAAQGEPTVKGPVVTQALKTGLPAGRYEIRYQVVSADGHPIAGATKFRSAVAQPAATTPPPTTAASSSNPPPASVAPTAGSTSAAPSAAASTSATTSATGEATSAATAAPDTANTSADTSGPSSGLIIGLTIAVLLILAAAAGAIWWRRRSA